MWCLFPCRDTPPSTGTPVLHHPTRPAGGGREGGGRDTEDGLVAPGLREHLWPLRCRGVVQRPVDPPAPGSPSTSEVTPDPWGDPALDRDPSVLEGDPPTPVSPTTEEKTRLTRPLCETGRDAGVGGEREWRRAWRRERRGRGAGVVTRDVGRRPRSRRGTRTSASGPSTVGVSGGRREIRPSRRRTPSPPRRHSPFSVQMDGGSPDGWYGPASPTTLGTSVYVRTPPCRGSEAVTSSSVPPLATCLPGCPSPDPSRHPDRRCFLLPFNPQFTGFFPDGNVRGRSLPPRPVTGVRFPMVRSRGD